MTEQVTEVTSGYDSSAHTVGGPLLLMHSVKEKVCQVLQLLQIITACLCISDSVADENVYSGSMSQC